MKTALRKTVKKTHALAEGEVSPKYSRIGTMNQSNGSTEHRLGAKESHYQRAETALGAPVHEKNCRGFTQIDLLAILVVVGLLGAWLATCQFGERGRIARCARNLEVLGQAMQSFANDHGSAIPPAGVDAPRATWDGEIAPYVGWHGVQHEAAASRHLPPEIAARFSCPSDPFLRGTVHRSYAMSSHDMAPQNWPPGPDNATGVGLWWDGDDIVSLLGHESQNPDDLALVKFSWFPDPANTLLLAECPHPDNRLGQVEQVRVAGLDAETAGLSLGLPQIHYGRFNYLMADGHVEWLTGLQTGGIGGTAGIWTIKKGD